MGSTGIQLIYRDKKYISFFPMAMKDYGMIAPLHGISSEDSEIRGKKSSLHSAWRSNTGSLASKWIQQPGMDV